MATAAPININILRMAQPPVPAKDTALAHIVKKLVRPAGLEPAASRLEVSRSIQMSYGRAAFPLGPP